MATGTGIVIQTIKDVTVATFESRSVIDVQHISHLGDQLFDLVEKRDRRRLVLDMGKVVHLSSAALSVLTKLRKLVDQVDGTLIICGLSPEIMKLFKVTGLHKLFEFVEDEKAALDKLGVVMA
ncbi:MAG: STAS domain-containing protein [Phycisphaerae bacterium]|nr:STAS domain-containing protein [Phycisphaerae bacterium]